MKRLPRWLIGTRLGRLAGAAIVVIAISAGWVAWWLGSPLFIDRTVEEEFPLARNAVVSPDMTLTRSEVEGLTRGMEEADVQSLIERMAHGEQVTDEMQLPVSRPDAETMMAGRAEIEEPTTEAMPGGATTEATPLLQGEFRDADGFHKGSGIAVLYRLPDGSDLLRLEEFRVTNGPDLRVILSAHPDPMSQADLDSGGYVELGRLKGNIGNQNYPVPSDIDPLQYRSVVIYCKPFRVLFSIAPLAEP